MARAAGAEVCGQTWPKPKMFWDGTPRSQVDTVKTFGFRVYTFDRQEWTYRTTTKGQSPSFTRAPRSCL